MIVFFASLVISTTCDAADFEELRRGAVSVGSTAEFVEHYVGRCGSVLEGGGECKRAAEAFRRKSATARHAVIVSEESALITARESEGTVTFLVTPFIAALDSAITHGTPARTDAAGNPVLPWLQVEQAADTELDARALLRLASMRGLRMEVIFRPQGLWQLPRKGGGRTTGVKAQFEALRITVGRTGQQVALWRAR